MSKTESNATTTETITFIGTKPKLNLEVLKVLIGDQDKVTGKILYTGGETSLRVNDVLLTIATPDDKEFIIDDELTFNKEGEIIGEALVDRSKNALLKGAGCNAGTKFY